MPPAPPKPPPDGGIWGPVKRAARAIWRIGSTPLAGPKHPVDLVAFLGRLTDPHTWLRVAEVLTGAVLIFIGVGSALKQPVTAAAARAVRGAL